MRGAFFLLGAIYFFNVSMRMLFPLLAPVFLQTFSSSQMAVVYFLLALGYGISLLGSQFLSAKIGYGRVTAISSMGIGITLLFFPYIQGVYWLGFFLLLFGLFGGLFIPSAISYLRLIIEESKLAKSIGFFSIFQTSALILAPMFCMWFGRQAQLPVWGAVLIMLGVSVMAFCGRIQEKGVYPSLALYKETFASRIPRTLFFLQCLAVALNAGIYQALPMQCGIPEDSLYFTIAGSRVLGIFVTLLGGVCIDRWGVALILPVALVAAGCSTFLVGLFGSHEAIYLQGASAAALNVMIHMAVAKTTSPPLMSFFAAASFLVGTGIAPQLFAFFEESSPWVFFFLATAALYGAWSYRSIRTTEPAA